MEFLEVSFNIFKRIDANHQQGCAAKLNRKRIQNASLKVD